MHIFELLPNGEFSSKIPTNFPMVSGIVKGIMEQNPDAFNAPTSPVYEDQTDQSFWDLTLGDEIQAGLETDKQLTLLVLDSEVVSREELEAVTRALNALRIHMANQGVRDHTFDLLSAVVSEATEALLEE